MSNIFEFNNQIAFHPGYYIKEYIDGIGLTQEDFAKRLGTTPKNLSYLIRGEQSLSPEIALKLSSLIGTSVNYWLNLQSKYDSLKAEFSAEKEKEKERELFKLIGYKYFKDNFNLPDLPKKIDEQIIELRRFLGVSSLTVFTNKDMYVNFRGADLKKYDNNIIKANIMVQIATNLALKELNTPKYNRKKLEQSINYILTLTDKHDKFYPEVKKVLYEAGVNFIVMPHYEGSKINGACKRINNHHIMLMVSDRNTFSDSFWFTLFHELGHIIHGDFGVSFIDQSGEIEEKANKYAENKLIPEKEYKEFIKQNELNENTIRSFSKKICRDSGIVLGRLQKDGYIKYNDWRFKSLRCKYTVVFK